MPSRDCAGSHPEGGGDAVAVSGEAVVAPVCELADARDAQERAGHGPAAQLAEDARYSFAAGEFPIAVEDHHGVLCLFQRDAGRKDRVIADELEDAARIALVRPGHAGLADAAV